MALYTRNTETGATTNVWAGEFHGIAGEGKVSEFVRSMTGGATFIYLSDHRTGDTRMVPFREAWERTI
jgi:hypothetical protein